MESKKQARNRPGHEWPSHESSGGGLFDHEKIDAAIPKETVIGEPVYEEPDRSVTNDAINAAVTLDESPSGKPAVGLEQVESAGSKEEVVNGAVTKDRTTAIAVPAGSAPIDTVRVYNPPDVILSEAQKAAKALIDVMSRKKNPVIFRGEQYLECEDWQTIGKFYGLTAQIEWTRPVGENCLPLGSSASSDAVFGFEAKAIITAPNGRIISTAHSLCTREEENWANKPLFQLFSMAQTRAISKVHRNVLSWVVVLAGYRPTPAEELPLEGREVPPKPQAERRSTETTAQAKDRKGLATENQIRLIHVLFKRAGFPTDQEKRDFTSGFFARTVEHLHDLTFKEASNLIDHLQEYIKSENG